MIKAAQIAAIYWIITIMLVLTGTSEAVQKPQLFQKVFDGSCYAMEYDGKYYWFAGIFNAPITRYEPVTQERKNFNINPGSLVTFTLSIAKVKDQIWFSFGNYGIAVYKNDNFSFISPQDICKEKAPFKVISVKYDPYLDGVWVGTSMGQRDVFYYDLKTFKWNDIKINAVIKDMDGFYINLNQEYVVVTGHNGLYYYQRRNSQWYYAGNLPNMFGLQMPIIYGDSIIFINRRVDDKKNIDYNSIYRYDISKKSFITIETFTYQINELNPYRDILIVSCDQGILFYNLKNKKRIMMNRSGKLSIEWVNMCYLEKDNFWVLTQDAVYKGKTSEIMEYVMKRIQ